MRSTLELILILIVTLYVCTDVLRWFRGRYIVWHCVHAVHGLSRPSTAQLAAWPAGHRLPSVLPRYDPTHLLTRPRFAR